MTELSLAAWLPLFPRTEGVRVLVESLEVHTGNQERRDPSPWRNQSLRDRGE